jgi:GT2 family glycosyltransferase
MDLAVHIATAQRPDLLARTLSSLGECRLPECYRETVVVENGPRGGAEGVVRGAPERLNARYLYCPQPNKSVALNAALPSAGDGLVFYTDDDVRLSPDILVAYAGAAGEGGPGHFFGGPMDADYESTPPDWLYNYLPRSVTGWEWEGAGDEIGNHEFLGANWAAFACDLRAVDGFSVELGPGSASGGTGEETNLQRRLRERGLSAKYVSAARVWHYVPADRCWQDWAIQRIFRSGIENAAGSGGHRSYFGLPPWWMLRQCVGGIARSIVWSCSMKHERRFLARYRRSYDRGLLHGLRCERQARRCTASV